MTRAKFHLSPVGFLSRVGWNNPTDSPWDYSIPHDLKIPQDSRPYKVSHASHGVILFGGLSPNDWENVNFKSCGIIQLVWDYLEAVGFLVNCP
jgi:hypothetical protein